MNIFPKFRDEHSKNIWVATTLFRILLTPSPGKKVLCRGSLSMGIIKGQWWLIIPLLRPYLLGTVALKGGGAPEIPMFQESSHSHGRPVGFQDIFVGWPEVCALCMNAYIYIYSESTLHPVTVASKSFFCMQGFHSKHVSKSWWSLASCVGGRPNINIYIICIYIYIYIFIHQYIHSWFATKIQVQTTHGEKLVKNRSGNTLSYNECWTPSDCFTNSFPQDVREKLEMPQWQRSVEGEVNRHGHHGCGNLSAHKKHMAMGSWARKRARWWVTFAFFGVGLVFFFWGRNSQRGELFSEEFVEFVRFAC